MVENNNKNTYTRQEVYDETLKYFKGDELATNVWINKYCLKDSEGNLYELTPDDMHKRLAKEFARIEKKYPNPLSEEEIYGLMKDFKYLIPGGSNLFGIGNDEYLSSLSNCFYIHHNNNDSYGNIMKLDEELVHLFKRRAGVGIDISFLRPKDSIVKNAALSTTGAVSFMHRFSNTTQEVALNGRRAALMITMNVQHIEIEDFIEIKQDLSKVNGANISIKVTDEFMLAVKEDKEFELRFKLNNGNWIKKIVNAKQIWNKFINATYNSAEPGLLYWDQIKRESPSDGYEGYEIEGVNPCSELNLSDSESCRLMSINLTSFVNNPFTDKSKFDFDKFKVISVQAQRLMDDMIDLECEKIENIIKKVKSDPEDEEVKFREINLWKRILKKAKEGRRTGLGITGLADVIAMLGYRYGTKQCTEICEKTIKQLAIHSYNSSIYLAKERNSFVGWNIDKDKKSTFINRIISEIDIEHYKKYGRRNIANLCIAPNGSLAILSGTSSGVEPAFMLYYTRRTRDDKNYTFIDDLGNKWKEYNTFHTNFINWYKIKYKVKSFEQAKKLLESLSDKELNNLIEESPYHKATANEIDFFEKVRMQGKVGLWIDHSISMTINLPENISKEEVSDLYIKAWEHKLKGMTIYREGSRSGVLVDKNKSKSNGNGTIKINNAPVRPKKLKCDIIKFVNNKEQWIGFIGLLDNNSPYEIFTGKLEEFHVPNYVESGFITKIKDNGHGSRYDFTYIDKQGYEVIMQGLNRVFDRECWNYAKLISSNLRHGVPLKYIVKFIEDLRFENDSDFIMTTWKKGVIRMIKKYIKDGEKALQQTCPECKTEGSLVYKEGCISCIECCFSFCN